MTLHAKRSTSMPEDTLSERVAVLETQMDAVLKFDSRLTRLERALYMVIGAAGVSAVGGGASIVSLLVGG